MTSASTLIRRAKEAEKKGHKFAAARLREEAAKLRREARKKTTYTKPADFEQEPKPLQLTERFQSEARCTPGAVDPMVDRLMEARTGHEFGILLRKELVEARHAGERAATDLMREQIKAIEEDHRINVVSGFMATVEASERLNNGALPISLTVAGYTVAKIYDALRKAGYNARGDAPVRD